MTTSNPVLSMSAYEPTTSSIPTLVCELTAPYAFPTLGLTMCDLTAPCTIPTLGYEPINVPIYPITIYEDLSIPTLGLLTIDEPTALSTVSVSAVFLSAVSISTVYYPTAQNLDLTSVFIRA